MLKGYTDNPNMVNKVRKISMTINLNAPGEYDGGNLKFDFGPHASGKRFHECEEIRPQGSIILFPSFVYHQVTPVTRGTRYSLVLWSLGWPFQ
jgi:PKHD-type hydroxylase